MRVIALVLIAVFGSVNYERSEYWPLSSETSLLVEIDHIGTWGPGPQKSYVTLYGSGFIRITGDSITHYRWVPPFTLVSLVEELAQVDFLHLQCKKPWGIDHFTAIDLTLFARGDTHHVSLINCEDDVAPHLYKVVDQVDAIAKRTW